MGWGVRTRCSRTPEDVVPHFSVGKRCIVNVSYASVQFQCQALPTYVLGLHHGARRHGQEGALAPS